ncbi:MAG TPA: cupredoxin family copper-binding protein [Actinomycetota bacterium]|nr:cupredoxin family copper-binding protein [Actinomycetota bacterium]
MAGKKLFARKRTVVAFVGGAAAIVLLMSACGGSSSAMPMPAGGGSASASAAAVRTDQVKIANFAFAPAAITVVAGTTVTWTNGDSVQHDVFAPTAGLQSPVLSQNDSYAHTFSTPGTYHYICSIHPFMHGTVVVTAT